MPFVPIANANETVPAVIMLVALLAGYRAGRLAFAPTGVGLARSARRLRILLVVVAVAVVAELVSVGLNAWFGWAFVAQRVLVALPSLVVPAAVVAAQAPSRLRALRAGATRLGGAVPDGALRSAAADPWLVAPTQVLAIGSVVCFAVSFVVRPVPPYSGDAVLAASVTAYTGLILAMRQVRRRRAMASLPRRGRPRRAVHGLLGAGLAAGLIVAVGASFASASRLPDRYSMADMHGAMDLGGGSAGGGPAAAMAGMGGTAGMAGMAGMGATTAAGPAAVSVPDLVGPTGTPDASFELVAEATPLHLSSGALVDAWTFNGTAPGPELRVHQGDLVEVRLVNHLPGAAVTLHWHGLDVPNGQDGVPGLTQDAVPPGGSFVYRFRADQVGTFWYHSHTASSEQVTRGLFGSLVVAPKAAAAFPDPTRDIVVMAHTWAVGDAQRAAFGSGDGVSRETVPAGTPVRLRITSTSTDSAQSTAPLTLALNGVPFTVSAVDGTPVNRPGELRDARLPLATGGRYDVSFVMPHHAVQLLDLDHPGVTLLLGTAPGQPAPTAVTDGPLLDLAAYGTAAPTPFGPGDRVDRDFTLTLDDGPGFYDGAFGLLQKINGASYPDTPMLMVAEGDLVRTTIVNRSHADHPMHLHGHHALVLSRDGVPVSGSPWWTDTLEVEPGQTFVFEFRADNPGIWMDHCHNLYHAADGMVMHLAYLGVTTPFQAGRATGNVPE